MRKKASVVYAVVLLALLAVATAPYAHAAPVLGIDPTGNGVYSVHTDLLTHMTDTGLLTSGAQNTMDFIYQGRVGTMQFTGAAVTPSALNNSYELTIQTRLPESITNQISLTDTGGVTHQTTVLGSVQDTEALVEMFFDSSPDADPKSGSGYGDGVKVLTGHLQGLDAVLDTATAAQGAQTSNGSFTAHFTLDTVNGGYLDIVNADITGFTMTGTMNEPPFFTPASLWDGTASAGGALVKVDASTSFTASGPSAVIPEPSTLMLLGAGMLGLFGASRMRKST
ncbi:MAG: PEP-CTERM sorting domain-containing protein [Nitrospirales bacterium]|nr:PEP-CTERM sorting domain-containing protein [Nitrospirales bacterium]